MLGLLVLVVSTRSCAVQEPERIGRRALSSAAGLRIFASPSAYGRFPPAAAVRTLAEDVRRTRTRAGGARARARRDAGGERRDRPRRRRGGHRQDPARVRAREPRPRAQGSRSSSGARSISSARSCPTSRSSRRCVRSESFGGSTRRPRARSCGCSRRRSRCSPTARPPRPCCSCSRICTGPTRRRSTSSSSSRTTSTTGRCCCSRPTARTSPRRPSAMRRLADGVRRSGAALVLELGPLAHDELAALLAARADAPVPAR